MPFTPVPSVQVVKQIQSSTKVMQHICAHAKIKTDKKVIALVPLVKKNLETFLFKVKASLTSTTNSLEGWYMGNIKHRDLSGKEVRPFKTQHPRVPQLRRTVFRC